MTQRRSEINSVLLGGKCCEENETGKEQTAFSKDAATEEGFTRPSGPRAGRGRRPARRPRVPRAGSTWAERTVGSWAKGLFWGESQQGAGAGAGDGVLSRLSQVSEVSEGN